MMGKKNRWIGTGARIFALTFLSTLLSFAVTLFFSILGTVVYAGIEHVPPNLVYAYRHIAFPIALLVGSVALVVTVAMEVRTYRQGKVLAAIERTAMKH